MNPNDTTYRCPHCGADRIPMPRFDDGRIQYYCGSGESWQSYGCRSTARIRELEAEVARLGRLLFETRSLLTEFYDCVDIGGLHDGCCNISTEDPEKWDLGCNCYTAELRRKYTELYSK